MIDIKAETLEETLAAFKAAVYERDVLLIAHKGMNILTEAVRRNAQISAKLLVVIPIAIFLLDHWGNTITGN